MGEDSRVARYCSEFLGTFILVFTVGFNVITGQPVWGGISIACSLTVMIYALGKSSGANFNPAVSFALCCAGKLHWVDAVGYIVVQCIAGISAGVGYGLLFGFHEAFNLGPPKGHSPWQACLAETLYTFLLVFVVLNTAASKKHAGKNQFYGIAIGFSVVAGAYGAGSISMGCFNPAVALGIDIGSYQKGIFYCMIYPIFEFIGAGLAVVFFFICRPDECIEDEDEAHDVANNYPLGSKLVSEFLGTYFLVLTVGLNVLAGSKAGAFSIACALMCMIFSLGSVSGAHFNPAVTVAVMCSGRGKILPLHGILYILVQIIGGISGAFTFWPMMNLRTFALRPQEYEWYQSLTAEFVYTFVLTFVVLSVATTKKGLSEYFAFAIGMCVTAGGVATSEVSGGSMNPAVSIGISGAHWWEGGKGWRCFVYAAVEILAGIVAAGAFRLTQPSEYEIDEDDECIPFAKDGKEV